MDYNCDAYKSQDLTISHNCHSSQRHNYDYSFWLYVCTPWVL